MLEFITGVLEATGDFLGGLPAPAWTVMGAVIGVVGTLLTGTISRRSERKRARDDRAYQRFTEYEARKRSVYVEVIALVRDLQRNTLYERSVILKNDPTKKDEQVAAKRLLMEKLTSIDTAVLRARLDSDHLAKEQLKRLRQVAQRYVLVVGGGDSEELFDAASESLNDALNDFTNRAHEIFSPPETTP